MALSDLTQLSCKEGVVAHAVLLKDQDACCSDAKAGETSHPVFQR